MSKILPHDLIAEEYVLGCLLMFRNSWDDICDILTTYEMFYDTSYGVMFKAIQALKKQNKNVDYATVRNQLKETDELLLCGENESAALHFITSVTKRTGMSLHIKDHARIIALKYVKREQIRIAHELVKDAYDDKCDAYETNLKYETKLIKIADASTIKVNDSTGNIRSNAAYDLICRGLDSKNGLTGVPVGLETVNDCTGGFQKGDLIVMAGKPGTFKTALALWFAHGAANAGYYPYMFQQEMTPTQTGLRELGMLTGVNTKSMRTGQITRDELVMIQQQMETINKSKVFIEHQSRMSVNTMVKRLTKAKIEKKIEFAIVDYLQISDLTPDTKGELDAVTLAKVSMKMKNCAKDLEIPFLALSQFARQQMGREAKTPRKPNNAMLLGSGGIEANADVTLLLFNAYKEFVDLGTSKEDVEQMLVKIEGSEQSIKGVLTIVVGKHRMGDLKDLYIGVRPHNNQFYDLPNVLSKIEQKRSQYANYHPDSFSASKIEANNDFENEKKHEDVAPF